MSIFGSQYADKVFSEHPIALWPLDEENYYLSLIDNNDRLFSTWTLSNCTHDNNPSIPDAPSPFDSDIYSALIKSTSGAGVIEAESTGLFDSSNISLSIPTFCVNFFMYQKPTYINWFKVGYRYLNSLGVQQEIISQEIPPPALESWVNFNKIYDLPISWQGQLKIFIQISYKNSSGGDQSSRTVIMNGLSVGQNSETTCYVSLGGTAISLPESTGLQSLKGIPADQYGTLADNAYYVVRNNNLLSYNDGFPIIYGTNNSTKIESSDVNLPSLIFPGKGMLHEKGRNKQYTFEMWMKIDVSTSVAKKIIGPLDSNDGIYVKEEFLTLVVGNQIASHCVSEWYRPMLINLLFKEKNIVMLLNGEEVINIPFDRSTIQLSNSEDWWGIYSYPSVKMFKVDCISIYPYIVPALLAKKRFVYGQAAPSIQSIDNTFKGTPTTIDFSTAEYSSNIIYPDFGRWDAGYFSNLNATKDYISVPNYQLPVINIGGRNIDEWYNNNYIINTAEYQNQSHPKFVTFRPNQVTRTNLIINPSFETNTTSWTGNSGATIARSTSEKYIGTASCLVTQVASNYSGIILSPSSIPVTSGNTYTLSVYVKGVTASQSLILNVHQLNSGGSIVAQSNSGSFTLLSSDGWVRKSITFTAASGVVSIRPMMMHPSLATAGNQFYIDGFLFEQASTVLPYFDGSYADPNAKAISHGWTGTANASTSTLNYWNSDGINYTEPSYFNFQSLNILNDPLVAAYGVFEIEQNIASPRTLMSFVNTIDGNSFDINIEGNTIKYLYNGSVIVDSQGNQATENINIGTEVVVGINFENLGIAYGFDVSRFFSSPSSIQLYIGGNGSNTFEGKIYVVGFCNQNNYIEIQDNFQSNGIIKKQNYEIIIDHIASYTLIAEYEYQKLYLDISVSCEWEEYFPLTYFASYVKDENGNPFYDLDMLQINLGYASTQTDLIWTYQELKTDFNGQTYQNLKNSVYTNYFNLNKKNTTGETINIKNSSLQGYITFQPLENENNVPLTSFQYEKAIPSDLVIDPDLENTTLFPERAYQTKFSFKDNVIVYPPKSKNFEDYSMVISLKINQRSILKNPLKIKSLEISSKNLNYPLNSGSDVQKNYVGTKFGTKIYPEIDIAGSIDYKSKNPYLIYKQNTPYIYTTKKSGIKIINKGSLANPTSLSDHKISIPINSNGSFNFKVSAINFFVLADLPDQNDQIPFLNIKHKNGIIALVLNKQGSQTNIIAYNKDIYTMLDGGTASTQSFLETWDAENSNAILTLIINVTAGSLDLPTVIEEYTAINGINFYQNGNYVQSPFIRNNEWINVSILFDESLDFSQFFDGAIELFGDFVFNNISYYLQEGLEAKIDLSIRTWDNILNKDYDGVPVPTPNIWSYWSANNNTWQYVYILGQKYSYITTPETIYQTYMGTNKNIVDDGYGLQLAQKETKVITNASWSSYTNKPA